MDKTLHYLFDPLCGWCYGAAPAVSGLLEFPGVSLELLPTGLFSGEGARPLDDAFAAYAWSNDQRIERLTGQRFSERYRDRILGDRRQLFDSGPATVALTAVSLTEPARELDALKAIQHARYVDGNDVISLAALADLLKALGLDDAAAKVAYPDAELIGANQARVNRAQALMREFGSRGVPTLIVESGSKRRVLDHAAAYSNPHALINQLEAA
ncbi:DsbA family protein [Xanthomonas hortorum]|uniref:DsbA family protein n=1 Tax=Xanthomonas hortorum TaxID=56454 RepID=A0AA47IC26_9XANT|nr:DsbA family protein [Xanthomonas hortorum]WAH65039.1 DsbA family protein [Xanthomonas hortorum]